MAKGTFWLAESGLAGKNGFGEVGSTLSLFGQILQLILIFALVVALAYFSARFMRQRALGAASSRYLRAVEMVPLGTGARLAVVEVGEKRLLLGVTEHHIELLVELEGELPDSGGMVRPEGGFLEQMKGLLERMREPRGQ
ncbi:MAG: flagellar biosynthetic protein FliO [Firmicutes bacterium]|nr:flagellar biosynthetic protein FliO [Bacillota bacterium]MCL5039513.1 flagellar biosynthetic protein FliO [Bacillota bacterium]